MVRTPGPGRAFCFPGYLPALPGGNVNSITGRLRTLGRSAASRLRRLSINGTAELQGSARRIQPKGETPCVP